MWEKKPLMKKMLICSNAQNKSSKMQGRGNFSTKNLEKTTQDARFFMWFYSPKITYNYISHAL